MITISNDAHLKTSTITVLDNGQKLMRKKLYNDPNEILAFIRQFPSKKQYSMEATYNWPVFHNLLKDEVDEFHLLNPKKLKNITESQTKCDKRDADDLAYLTYTGYIPKAHTANVQTRQFRHLLRAHVRLSANIASIKNRIHAIINTNVFYSQRPKNFKDLFCKRGLDYLKNIPLPEHERFLVNRFLRQIKYTEKIKASLAKKIKSINFRSQDLRYLKTVPGMGGEVLNYIVLAEIDNIARFRNARALIAYAGLIPKDKSSGGKSYKGRLRTDTNKFLRWAMIESVPGALLRDPRLRPYYREVKQRNNSSAARVAVARKLLTAIYYVLKEQRPYYVSLNRR